MQGPCFNMARLFLAGILFHVATGDGIVRYWGSSILPPVPQPAFNATAIASGSHHMLALKDGFISSWGSNTNHQLDVPSDIQGHVEQIACAQERSLALLDNKTAVCWGGCVPVPDAIQGQTDSIKAMYNSSAAKLRSGKWFVWREMQDFQQQNTLGTVDSMLNATDVIESRWPYGYLVLLSNGTLLLGTSAGLGVSELQYWPYQDNVVAACGSADYSIMLFRNGSLWADFDKRTASNKVVLSQLPGNFTTPLACGSSRFLIGLSTGDIGVWNGMVWPPAVTAMSTIGFTSQLPPIPPVSRPPSPLPLQRLLPPPHPVPLSLASTSSSFPTAAVAGAVVGGGAVLLLVVVGILVRMRYARKQKQLPSYGKHGPGGASAVDDADGIARVCVDAEGGLAKAMDIPGIMKGDVFTRATAHAYSWVRDGLKACDVGGVEAGVNDHLLDKSATNGIVPPAIQLSMQQVRDHILLLQDGLLGRGATALVFKCLWPSRFGKNCALAIKVLNDGYSLADAALLESFSYEASVLSSLYPPHPNVVRLYGYCMEPPTVCLILELLPLSLKSLLRNEPATKNISPLLPKVLARRDKSLVSQNTGTVYVTSSSDASLSSATRHISNVDASSIPKPDDGAVTHALLVSSDGTSVKTVNSAVTTSSTSSTVHTTTQLNMLQVCSISLDIAAGLKYLHSKPIAGQDAVMEESEDVRLVSVQEDAAYIKDEGAQAATSKTSQIVHRDHIGAGTLPCMPPELLMGAHVKIAAAVGATNRVDIYSTAMIMWEMLAGRAPWSNLSADMLQFAVLNGRRPELPTDNSNANNVQSGSGNNISLASIPASLGALPEFNAIIRACWQQRDHRRPSAAELYDMLFELMKKYSSSPKAY